MDVKNRMYDEVKRESSNRHYKLTDETLNTCEGVTLHRIECTEKFTNQGRVIEVGEKGGWIETEDNLSGDAWVYDNAKVYGKAKVHGCASIYHETIVSQNADIYGTARLSDNAFVFGNACVCGNAEVSGNTQIKGDALVGGEVALSGDVAIFDNAIINTISPTLILNGHFGDSALIRTNDDYIVFDSVGSRHDILTVYKTPRGGIRMNTGCFSGSIDEFKTQVMKTHKDNEKIKNEYLLILEVIKNRFDINI